MRKFVSIVFVIALMTASSNAEAQRAEAPARLVVLVVVDQMRADYLDRFADQFTGGFARLRLQGTRYTDAHHAHAVTATAPGHATLATGVHPARHGIPANAFWDRNAGSLRYAAEDDTTSIIGAPDAPGRSPSQLRRETIGDWLRQASPESQVYAVSGKDRSAVLMGGQRPTAAYWYHASTGTFVTSTYYMDTIPDWVRTFNAERRAVQYARVGWTPLRPAPAYASAREDDFAVEAGGTRVTFPHRFLGYDSIPPMDALPDDSLSAALERVYKSPFVDAMVLEFARELVARARLGSDDVPDLLLLSLSAGDLIGHDYGPQSQEVADSYMRLDAQLDTLFAVLDASVGATQWSAILSSDHGAPLIAEEYARRGEDAARVTLQDLQQVLVPPLQEALVDVKATAVPQLQALFPFGLVMAFPEGTISDSALATLRETVAGSIRSADWARDAFTWNELHDSTTADRPYITEYRRSFVPDRGPDVAILFREHHFLSLGLMVDHGTPYAYDTHVPLIVMGTERQAGTIEHRVFTVQVAPTLASMLGISAPDDLDGEPLEY